MSKRTSLVAAALFAVPLWIGSAALAHTPYDGTWSVLIVTDSGTCDRAYRYAVHIVDGNITYDNPSFDVSGHVEPNGRVHVTVRHGAQEANGDGRLSGDSGEGHWSGSSPSARCAGHWEADRRG